MLQSKYFMPTLKETPADAEAVSHQMMLRGGYIRQVTAGVYSYLPLSYTVLTNISNIIREEMAKIDVPEMMMPILLPASLWQESGRYEGYGPNLFKLKDRHDRDSILGPTHEETFTDIVAKEVRSYKKLPFMLYQIQTKFRDENRPRFGLLRGREFVMKDAYSFAATYEQLDEQYDAIDGAYRNIFKRVGLQTMAIIGDAGAMGGSDSTEFQAPAAVGEDTVVFNASHTYAANLEMAKSIDTLEVVAEAPLEMEEVATPGIRTIAELAEFMQVPATKIVKSVLYFADDKPVLVLIRGDKQVNEVKLKNYLSVDELRIMTDGEEENLTGALPGGVGPINATFVDTIVADETIAKLTNFVVGANKTGFQIKNVNLDRDFSVTEFTDIALVNEGELDPIDHEPLQFTRGIEIGHIFKLGTRYSESMKANFLDENGKEKPVIMGSYGIGVSRLLSAIVEQNHSERGIFWPASIAPFKLHIVQMKMNDETQTKLAQEIYAKYQGKFEVLYDDRNERAGVKFADADLVGAPVRVIIGKKSSEGIVEVKEPRTGESSELDLTQLDEFITKEIG